MAATPAHHDIPDDRGGADVRAALLDAELASGDVAHLGDVLGSVGGMPFATVKLGLGRKTGHIADVPRGVRQSVNHRTERATKRRMRRWIAGLAGDLSD